MLQLGEVAAQTDGLLIHRDLIREDGRLGEDAVLIDLGILEHLRHLGLQPGAVVCHDSRGTRLHLSGEGCDGGGAGADVLHQLLPLPGAHGVKVLQGQGQHLAQVGGHRFQILLVLLHQKHVGHPGEQGDRDVILQAIAVPQVAQGLIVAVGHRPVDRDIDVSALGGPDGDEHIHLAPGNALLYLCLDGILRKDIDTGQLDRTVQIAVIDGAQLYRDGTAAEDRLSPSVTGHTFNQRASPRFSSEWGSASHRVIGLL